MFSFLASSRNAIVLFSVFSVFWLCVELSQNILVMCTTESLRSDHWMRVCFKMPYLAAKYQEDFE